MPFKELVTAFWMAATSSNGVIKRVVFNLRNRKKSTGLKSGLYGGCGKVETTIRTRYNVTWKAV